MYYQKALFLLANTAHAHTVDGVPISVDDAPSRNYMFMAAAVVAMKFYDDLHLSNSYIAKVYKVPLKTLNKWEVKLLEILDYSLFLHQAELDQIKYEFVSRIDA